MNSCDQRRTSEVFDFGYGGSSIHGRRMFAEDIAGNWSVPREREVSRRCYRRSRNRADCTVGNPSENGRRKETAESFDCNVCWRRLEGLFTKRSGCSQEK